MEMPVGKETKIKQQFVYVPHKENVRVDKNINKVELLESQDTNKSHSITQNKPDLLGSESYSHHTLSSHHDDTHTKENYHGITTKKEKIETRPQIINPTQLPQKEKIETKPQIINPTQLSQNVPVKPHTINVPINSQPFVNPLKLQQPQIPMKPNTEPPIKQKLLQQNEKPIDNPIDKPLGGVEHLTNRGLENFIIKNDKQKIDENKDTFFDQYINNDII